MGILEIAEINGEVRFMLGAILICVTILPLIHNVEGLITDFAPVSSHRILSVVSSTLYYSAMSLAVLAAGYIYYVMRGVTGILTFG